MQAFSRFVVADQHFSIPTFKPLSIRRALEFLMKFYMKKDYIVNFSFVLHDMIADMQSNKNVSLIVTELLLRGRKLNIPLVFISQCYFKMSKIIILNATRHQIMKIPNKSEL